MKKSRSFLALSVLLVSGCSQGSKHATAIADLLRSASPETCTAPEIQDALSGFIMGPIPEDQSHAAYEVKYAVESDRDLYQTVQKTIRPSYSSVAGNGVDKSEPRVACASTVAIATPAGIMHFQITYAVHLDPSDGQVLVKPDGIDQAIQAYKRNYNNEVYFKITGHDSESFEHPERDRIVNADRYRTGAPEFDESGIDLKTYDSPYDNLMPLERQEIGWMRKICVDFILADGTASPDQMLRTTGNVRSVVLDINDRHPEVTTTQDQECLRVATAKYAPLARAKRDSIARNDPVMNKAPSD